MIWLVLARSPTYDWKRNAGAAYLVQRTRAVVRKRNPPRVESNVPINCIELDTTSLYFLPDMVLYWAGGSLGGINYNDLSVEYQSTRFIEDEQVPTDATQVDQTWRYVRKDGGPDRRFNDNRLIPIMQYGAVTITSSKGLNILLNSSNVEATHGFANALLEFQGRRKFKAEPKTRKSAESISVGHASALRILGLEPGASKETISQAYRQLAQIYHPDKVSGLAPEFHELADRRMKEINAAYQILKGIG